MLFSILKKLLSNNGKRDYSYLDGYVIFCFIDKNSSAPIQFLGKLEEFSPMEEKANFSDVYSFLEKKIFDSNNITSGCIAYFSDKHEFQGKIYCVWSIEEKNRDKLDLAMRKAKDRHLIITGSAFMNKPECKVD